MDINSDYSPTPLVSIGMPVRNGGRLLTEALQQLIDQTYKNIEIIISDNNSSDATAEICREFQKRDGRILYYRQATDLDALNNFKFVQEKAQGDYFMWAAYDDRRALNYVETLVRGALDNPDCSLIFSNAADFDDHETMRPVPLLYDFATDKQMPFLTKLRRLLFRNTHFYGLYPRKIFQNWYWHNTDFGWDQIFLAFASMRGDFKKVAGTDFYYYRPTNRNSKTPQQRALEIAYRKLKPYPGLRRAWNLVTAACYGEKLEGRRRSRLWNFLRLYLPYVWWPWLKQNLVRLSPVFIRQTWRRLKGTRTRVV